MQGLSLQPRRKRDRRRMKIEPDHRILMNKELRNRIRENKYLTKNETDFIIEALAENASLREQVNMWQSEHAKRVLELGRLHENIKKAREEIEDRIDNYPDRNSSEYEDCLAILDKHYM